MYIVSTIKSNETYHQFAFLSSWKCLQIVEFVVEAVKQFLFNSFGAENENWNMFNGIEGVVELNQAM